MATFCHSFQNQILKLWPLVSSLFCQERIRKDGKCKISRVLQLPVSSPQASPKVEASNRLKQAQHFSTHRNVQNGNSLVPGEWVSSQVLPQVTGVPVHLSSFRPGHSPSGLYNDCKRSEANGPLEGTQTSPIPGLLVDQVSVSGRSPNEHKGCGRPNTVLGVDNKSGEIRTNAYSGVFVRGLRIPSRFSPCKTLSREIAQTSGFDPSSQVKTCFDCKMFDVTNWVACLNGENGPRGSFT